MHPGARRTSPATLCQPVRPSRAPAGFEEVPREIAPTVKRPTRRLAAAAFVLAAALGSTVLAGCSLRSPVQSVIPYQPSDGIQVTLSSLAVRDLLIVSSGAGAPGVLSGALVNEGSSAVQVSFAPSGATSASTPITVPPGQLVSLGGGTNAVHIQFPSVAAAPGALEPLEISTPQTGPSLLSVPVLDPVLEYATLTPTATPTSAPTSTPSDTASASPSPGSSGGTATATATPTKSP
jgi:hypothetical protein